jgi:uncharacterized membrane protein (DUF106 family)
MDEELEKDKSDEETRDNKTEEKLTETNEKKEENISIVPENKEGKISSLLKGKNKEGSFKPLIFVMIASLAIAMFWDKIPFIKDSVHFVLDPSAGTLLSLGIPYGLEIGMLLIILIISLLTTLVQKYATDQKALKELRKEQKILQEEMKKYKEHPEKMAELSKKQFEFIPKTFKLTSRAIMFTGVPFILFFRWFHDFFATMGDPKFFGVLSWLWFYLIFTMVFSSIFRKVLKVV